MAKDVVSIHRMAVAQIIITRPEDQILKDAIVNTHHMDVVQIIKQQHEAMIMSDAVANTRNTVVAQTKSLQLKVKFKFEQKKKIQFN